MAEMDAADYIKRGVEFLNKEDFDQGISDLREAYRLDTNNTLAKNNLAAAYFNRGVARFRKGDIDGAIKDLTEAIRFNPNDPQAYGARGTMYDKKGDHDGVIRDFTEVIRLNPNLTENSPYTFRAGAYHEKCKECRANGDDNNYFKYIDLCINDHKTALQIEPGDAMVREILKHATNERELRKETLKNIKDLKDMGL
jgi:tetratricopeptide (TPR) repeat protein